jgi:hypothetical protein
MPTVHVFVTTGRFRSFDEMRAYIDPVYDEDDDEDGGSTPSPFMTEVGLTRYEPMCIEAVPSTSGHPVPLAALLAAASYADQWLHRLDVGRLADAAVCVFAPNEVARPEGCSLEHLGAFEYRTDGPSH